MLDATLFELIALYALAVSPAFDTELAAFETEATFELNCATFELEIAALFCELTIAAFAELRAALELV